MFQIENRTASLSVSQADKIAINAKLTQFQQIIGQEFDSFKTLFSELLDNAIENVHFNENGVTHADNEVIVQLQDNEVERMNFLHLLSENVGNTNGITVENICTLIENSKKTVEIEKTVERPLAENEVILSFNEKELMILNKIRSNRFAKRKVAQEETLQDLTHKMILNDNVVFNLGGEFYTGL